VGLEDDAWNQAQRLCGLNDEEVGMAKELGFQPRSLIKNIPRTSQQWKAPVSEWVRSLYERKIRSRRPDSPSPTKRSAVIEFRNPGHPWPDKPAIPELRPYDPSADLEENFDGGEFRESFEPPSDEDTDEQNTLMLRRQCLFRWAAQVIALELSKVPEVQKLAAFGAVPQPLKMEVPRFRQFRRHRIETLHECRDLDLAVWMTALERLNVLRKALSRGLSLVQNTAYGGVAHHQVDVHIMDAATGEYRGRLCIFRECPKPGNRECLVPHCGEELFLRQFEGYQFRRELFEAAPKAILFDRDSGFLVRLPEIEVWVGTERFRMVPRNDTPF
jgi:hypothetical protein